MTALLIRDCTALLPSGLQKGTDIAIDGGRIARVGKHLQLAGAPVLHAAGAIAAPGFVDLHIHGAAGAMFEQGDPEAAGKICGALPAFGVTGILATVATLPPMELRRAVESIAVASRRTTGARILGIHLEGPFLNPARAGAQRREWMRALSLGEFEDLQEACGGLIRLVTLAPELDGALALVRELRARGVTVAMGHSDATAEQALLGIEAGATHVTHLFNAMRGLHHREPGLVGVALTDERVSVELICDGVHVAPRAVALALRCKSARRVALVSDAVGALGLADGEFDMFGLRCAIRDGAVRLHPEGTLAGSCLRLDRAVQNVRSWVGGIALPDLLRAASSTPAAVLGALPHELVEGASADLVLLDGNLQVVATICRGALAWAR